MRPRADDMRKTSTRQSFEKPLSKGIFVLQASGLFHLCLGL
jgi:hypothetical protein